MVGQIEAEGTCHDRPQELPPVHPRGQPKTGVTVHVLKEKVAPLQQGFYFVNASMTDDARFLWFYCAFPPSAEKTLGRIDFESGTVRHFPETGYNGASPWIDVKTGDAYWASRESIWRIAPTGNEPAECVNSLPADIVRARTVSRLATHLTRSADGKEFLVDSAFNLQWLLGTLPVDGGDYQLWHRFDRNYNHAQFSPTDPDLALFAEENHPDPITGLIFPIVDRMWLIRRGEAPRPLLPTPTRVTHEWWDRGGKHAWCVWDKEAWRTNIETQEVEKIAWPAHCWHAHDSADGNYIVGDSNERFFRGCPSTVTFLNRRTGRNVHIIDNPGMTGVAGTQYHIDPHPRFCGPGDEYVVFTTTVRGEVDVAMVETTELIAATS